MEANEKPVIQVRGLKKRYTLGQFDSKRASSALKATVDRLMGRPVTVEEQKSFHPQEFWALKGIDLDVYRGETLGIIGINGSGKSTLLKLLSRITSPTAGEIGICGISASMLEIGTGFSGDMTGRENIYLNGTILGMTRAEITKKLDEIIEFSECGAFIDTPVKRYSSGMYVRLAFSVSAFLDSDILMMDEVLAVGDTHFQKKCLDKMYSAAHDDHRTVLFVSHNMNSVQQLCTRCIVLNAGEKIFDGDVNKAISLYTNLSNAHGLNALKNSVQGCDGDVTLLYAKTAFLASNNAVDDQVAFEVCLKSERQESDVHVLLVFRDMNSVPVGSFYSNKSYSFGGDQLLQDMLRVDIASLAIGKYAVDVLLAHEINNGIHPFAVFPDAVRFNRSALGGASRLDWDTQKLGNFRLMDMSKNTEAQR